MNLVPAARPGPRAKVVLSLAALLAGCGFDLGEQPAMTLLATDNHLAGTPRNLPTHPDAGSSMLASLEGRLELEGSCLVVISGGLPQLPIWPSAFWLDGQTLRSGRDDVASIGENVTLVGGSITLAGRSLTNPVDTACAREFVFWTGGVHAERATQAPG